MIVGELHSSAVTDQVNATVADVGDGETIAFDCHRHNSRTHARMMNIPCSRFVDCLIRELDGTRQTHGAGRYAFEPSSANRSTVFVMAKILEDGVDSEFARQFSG